MAEPQIDLHMALPSPERYLALRAGAGLDARSLAAAEIGLANSLCGVLVEGPEGPIGMGRIIGDGGCFAQVTDIAVLPAYQGRGLGTRIVAALLDWADANLPEGCYISLIADPGAERLYERAGFAHRTGMSRVVPSRGG
ncbi:MAG: GNAT family N-acetyltransferase [Pseudomonadota bacterium]